MIDIVIIGGGAAGLMAAAMCVGRGKSVLLLEKNGVCGNKILITGKGRCNITNASPWNDFQHHVHPNKGFFKNSFYHFDNRSVVSFFETKLSLPTVLERGNRVFPLSMRSEDVRNSLVDYIIKGGIKIVYGFKVDSVKKDHSGNFIINNSLTARRVIVATGGLSYPATGSTGDGYGFASSFGHRIIDPTPSLTALKPKDYDRRLEGILLKNVRLDLIVNGSVLQSEFGELQFTSGGIEGALGFRVSRKGVKGLKNGQKVELVVDIKPALELSQIEGRVDREIKEHSISLKDKDAVSNILRRMLPKELVTPFIESASVKKISDIPNALKGWRFKIDGYVGYERCVITAGGVDLNEVSRKSLESKLVSGLYFAGEVLDLDGDTGGYNLQIAFSTGALAADSAILSLD